MFALRRMRFTTESTLIPDIPIKNELRIGSGESGIDVCLKIKTADLRIAPTHAVLLVTEQGTIAVRPSDTELGTFVNDERIEPNTLKSLHEDDILTLGGPSLGHNGIVNPVVFRVVRHTPPLASHDAPCATQSCSMRTDSTCSVCLDVFLDPVTFECEHTFCGDCADTWLHTSLDSRACPECRHPIAVRPCRVRALDTIIQKTFEPSMTGEERAARARRRDVLWNRNRIRKQKQSQTLLRRANVSSSTLTLLEMLNECIRNAREAAVEATRPTNAEVGAAMS